MHEKIGGQIRKPKTKANGGNKGKLGDKRAGAGKKSEIQNDQTRKTYPQTACCNIWREDTRDRAGREEIRQSAGAVKEGI